jgi:hypothetical protein
MRSRKLRSGLGIAAFALVAGLAGDALAIIGRPLTPFSYAGVARRTTRRTIAAGAAVGVGAAAVGAAAYGAYGVPVAAPPVGCAPGYPCGGVVYEPAYQGPSVVYVPQY